MMDSKLQSFKRYKEYENNAKMIGWDFSYLTDMIEEETLPFDYITIVKRYLKPGMNLLDMETGGGEILLKLNHPYHLTTVTEGYPPNYDLCLERLEPLGIAVHNVLGEEVLPFEDNTFDIIINRHGSYNYNEINRVLKKNGLFITQQVGSKNNLPLSSLLGLKRESKDFSLATELSHFIKSGLVILESDEYYQTVKYRQIEAVIFMAKIIDWEFPNFSVETCFNMLQEVESQIIYQGFVKSIEHRFYIVAKAKGDN